LRRGRNNPGESRQREAMYLTLRRQSVGRGRRRDGNMGALGRPARSLAAKYQTNQFSSGVGQFRKRSLRSAAKAGSSPRLLLLSSAIGEVSRPYC